MNRFIPALIAALLLSTLSINANAASCESTIRKTNIVATSLLTMANTWVRKGRSFTLKDAARSLVYGGIGGYGFYKAKATAGRGNVKSGVALAYLSSSIVENVIHDEHPLGYLRYGIGPAEVRFSTPLANKAPAFATFEFDPVEATFMAVSASNVSEWGIKDGILYGVSKDNLESDDLPVVYAQVGGRHIIIDKDHTGQEHTWRHESIHVLQNIQYQSFFAVRSEQIQNRFGFGSRLPGDNYDKGLNWVDTDLRFGWFHMPMALVTDQGDYEKRWDELEAAHLGEGHAPYGGEDEYCGGAGFSFEFSY
jgi:hypothetical protein